MPLLDLRQARAELRLSEVLALLGWTARTQRGVQVRGPCPLHGSRSLTSRSFSAHLGRNVWQCFRGGASGNALELWPGRPGRSSLPRCWICIAGWAGRCHACRPHREGEGEDMNDP